MKIRLFLLNPLFYIFLLIIILRYIGTNHGFPYIYNVDEPTLVKTTLDLRFSPWIDRFDWPHFNYYFHFIFYWIFIKFRALIQLVGLDGSIKSVFPIIWDDPFIFYVVSRIINTTLSIVSVIPVFYITKGIYSKKTAIITAISYLLFPYLASHSRYAIQDSAMMAWLAFYYWFLYRYWNSKRIKDLLLSAVFIGLATGVKYNAVLFSSAIPILLFLQMKTRSLPEMLDYIKRNILAGILVIGVFLLVCPSVIYYFELFWSNKPGVGIFWQLQANLVKYTLIETPYRAFLDYLDILKGTGILLSIGFILYPIFYRRLNITKENKIFMIVFWLISVGYFFYATRIVLSGPRFYLPIYPLIAMIGAFIYFELSKFKYYKYISNFYIAILFGVVVFQTIAFTQESTVNLAYFKYQELSKTNDVYIRGEDIERLNLVNNLGLRKLRPTTQLAQGNYIIGSRPLKLENAELVDTIEKMEGYNRLGPTIYIYRHN